MRVPAWLATAISGTTNPHTAGRAVIYSPDGGAVQTHWGSGEVAGSEAI